LEKGRSVFFDALIILKQKQCCFFVMKKILVIADIGWSIGRVHNDVALALRDVFEFKFVNQSSFIFQEVQSELNTYDACLTTHNVHEAVIRQFNLTTPEQQRKLVVVCHGHNELAQKYNWSRYITYGVVSDILLPHVPIGTHVVPNGVNPALFTHKNCHGTIKTLGWCGVRYVPIKRADWPTEIARKSHLPVSIAESLSFEDVKKWYHTIDILLVTSGPEVFGETGPLPPFEAIVSGIPVIGTNVGNFSKVPGPKFSTTDEAALILAELKEDPERVKNLATEQYNWVMENWTYSTHAKAWKNMFDAAIAFQQ
jgi:hypothetical protein